MAKYLDFKYTVDPTKEALRAKVEAAPFEHAAALLKAYELLDMAEKHGVLDVLRGAISAEDAIIDKVAGYANTPEGINTMRNLLILGKLLGTLDPDLLESGAKNLTASVVLESKKTSEGFFAITRRLFGKDALRGLAITIAALEGIGKTARTKAERVNMEEVS